MKVPREGRPSVPYPPTLHYIKSNINLAADLLSSLKTPLTLETCPGIRNSTHVQFAAKASLPGIGPIVELLMLGHTPTEPLAELLLV